MKIYHNPRCSTSRATLEIIREKGIEPEIVEYLKKPLTADEIKLLLQKLNLPPRAILRQKELLFRTNYEGRDLSDDELIAIMAEHPTLIERPIVEKGNKAIIGRPPGNVYDLIRHK
jgi:arsenate reductase